MRNYSISKSIYRLALLAILFLVGCDIPAQPIPTESLPASTMIPPAETQAAPATIPDIRVPDTPTPTPAPPATSTSTLTPLPTLDPQAAEQEITRLMETNNGCTGACFWGIIPGETEFDQAVRFLQTLQGTGSVQTIDSIKYYHSTFQYDDGKLTVLLAITDSNGKVYSLGAGIYGMHAEDVTGNDWLAFRPDNFLRANGVPQQVNVNMGEGPEGRVSYEMVWFYDQMYIQYLGNQIIIKPEHILHACPNADQKIQRVDLWLGPYEKGIRKDGEDLTWLTSLTPDQLSEILTGDPAEACFDLDYYKIYPPDE